VDRLLATVHRGLIQTTTNESRAYPTSSTGYCNCTFAPKFFCCELMK
jgi:hypothetical protein